VGVSKTGPNVTKNPSRSVSSKPLIRLCRFRPIQCFRKQTFSTSSRLLSLLLRASLRNTKARTAIQTAHRLCQREMGASWKSMGLI